MAISTDDLKGLPHLMILTTEKEIKVVTFTGADAMERCHEAAQSMALKDFDGCITVAARVRTICPFRLEHLMS